MMSARDNQSSPAIGILGVPFPWALRWKSMRMPDGPRSSIRHRPVQESRRVLPRPTPREGKAS
jgi:hypothetical protein